MQPSTIVWRLQNHPEQICEGHLGITVVMQVRARPMPCFSRREKEFPRFALRTGDTAWRFIRCR